jgi:hypothetical protein
MQARVEDFLEKTKPLLVIDEGQYLFDGHERISKHPELINWLDTACFNQGVPVAIVATLDFDRRRRAVEKQTTWSSEQFARRVKRAIELPATPTQEDLAAVARKRLPGATAPMIKYVVAYAWASRRFMDGIGEVIEDAQWICKTAGRQAITFGDLQRAVQEFRAPSDASLKRVLASDPSAARRGRQASRMAPATDLQSRFSETATRPPSEASEGQAAVGADGEINFVESAELLNSGPGQSRIRPLKPAAA